MASGFDGVNQSLYSGTTPIAGAPPFTMACWFRSDDDTKTAVLMSSADSAATNRFHALLMDGTVGGDPLAAWTVYNAGSGWAQSSSGITTGTWHHACGVWTATNNRAVFLDGANKGTNATDVTATSLDWMSIGDLWRGFAPQNSYYFTGDIAENAVWNVALTDAEVAVLAAGYSPLFVRPQNLVAYWPSIRGTVQSIVGSIPYAFANANGVTVEPHPPILYPYGYVTPGRAAPATLPGGTIFASSVLNSAIFGGTIVR